MVGLMVGFGGVDFNPTKPTNSATEFGGGSDNPPIDSGK